MDGGSNAMDGNRSMSGLRAGLLCALLVLWLAPANAVTLGIAPFERAAAKGKGVPDVAARLAERLGTRGLDKVVGPGALGGSPSAEPSVDQVLQWGSSGEVQAIVAGRTTRLGDTLSVDARIFDARTGTAVGSPLLAEVGSPDALGGALESLADQVVEALANDDLLPDVAAFAPSKPDPKPATGQGYQKNAPISIRSDNLEANEGGGQRKFVFTGNVHVVQGSMIVDSSRLEAFYPPGSSSPDRLVATGRVKITQTGRIAYCTKAIFYRTDDRMECFGNMARVETQCDQVQGEKITFHMDTEVMHVSGAADVKLRPEDPACAQPAAGGTGTGR